MSTERYPALRAAVERVPAVDSHAHNLVSLDSSFPFLRCFSEAEGEALLLAPHTLSFKRSIRDIAALYNCDASFSGLETHRSSSGLLSFGSKCFGAANLSAIFIDDGIIFDKMYNWEWHNCFVPAVGRILRIESLAESILNEGLNESKWTLDAFKAVFMSKLKSAANKIVAMKSIAAYRTGLNIDTIVSEIAAEEGLLEDLRAGPPVRLENKSFIDYLFVFSLVVAQEFNLPMQIHTGFGDKDLDLRLCNPLHLRPVLEDKRFGNCRIVLLHASYPFSKEASYLASVYPQVYLDFGLAVPKLSVQGMISSVKELLQLAPIKKVMFSSDGYAFPETFYLGSKRGRAVVYSVLSDACDDGDLLIKEAVDAVDDLFRENALNLYQLNGVIGKIDSTSYLPLSDTPKASPLPPIVTFVRVIWVDASGQHRCRVIPSKRFYETTIFNGVGLTYASMGMPSYADGLASGCGLTGVGEIRLIPDLLSKVIIPWSEHEEMVLSDMQVRPGEAWEYCPRDVLRRASKVLKDEFNMAMNAGFEIEFYLLKNVIRDGIEKWVSYDQTPYCSTSAFDSVSPIFQEIHHALQSIDIEVDQLHAESGNGQFEIALGHRDCTLAADKLIFSREVVRAVARKHGLIATFVPKYYLGGIGSGSHVHLSLWEHGKNIFMASEASITKYGMSKVGEQFMAGVYNHLPAILAFTAPLPNSYDRIQPNTWSGAYHCWGKENREAPLRTACPPGVSSDVVSNFELKSFDGCANPHLGLASILAAGIDGLRRSLSLPDPVEINPSCHTPQLRRLPKNLGESVEALRNNTLLKEFIGEKLVTSVIAIRKEEIDFYEKNKDAYKELIHRF